MTDAGVVWTPTAIAEEQVPATAARPDIRQTLFTLVDVKKRMEKDAKSRKK